MAGIEAEVGKFWRTERGTLCKRERIRMIERNNFSHEKAQKNTKGKEEKLSYRDTKARSCHRRFWFINNFVLIRGQKIFPPPCIFFLLCSFVVKIK
jgi:hypothetical protein